MFCGSVALGQSDKHYTINPGEKVTWVIPAKDMYAYPQFTPGVVYFKTRTTGGGMMNYSYLSQEMFFIDTKGDTLALSNPLEVDSVLFGPDVFYNTREGFVKLDTISGDIRLCQSTFFYISNKQVTGAYGQATDAAGNNRYNRFSSNYAAAGIVAQDIFTLKVNSMMYAGKRYGKFVPVTRKNMSALFSKNENAYNAYLKENDVDFSNRASVLKLLISMSLL